MKTCRWCDVPIRKCRVLVGVYPGRPVAMYIDVDPHPGEQVVIQRDDGQYRLLAVDRRSMPVKPTFRIHSRRNCAPKKAKARR